MSAHQACMDEWVWGWRLRQQLPRLVAVFLFLGDKLANARRRGTYVSVCPSIHRRRFGSFSLIPFPRTTPTTTQAGEGESGREAGGAGKQGEDGPSYRGQSACPLLCLGRGYSFSSQEERRRRSIGVLTRRSCLFTHPPIHTDLHPHPHPYANTATHTHKPTTGVYRSHNKWQAQISLKGPGCPRV